MFPFLSTHRFPFRFGRSREPCNMMRRIFHMHTSENHIAKTRLCPFRLRILRDVLNVKTMYDYLFPQLAVMMFVSASTESFLLLMLNLSLLTSVMYGVQCNLLGSTRGSFTGCFLANISKCVRSASMKYTPLTNFNTPRVFNAKMISSAIIEVFRAISIILMLLLSPE